MVGGAGDIFIEHADLGVEMSKEYPQSDDSEVGTVVCYFHPDF